MMEHEEVHVHFDEGSDTMPAHHAIQVQPVSDGKANVHLGLLLIHHRYEVKFPLDKALLPKAPSIAQDENHPNKNCRLLTITDLNDSEAELTVELITYKEKLQKETLVLVGKDGSESSLQLIFQARVLGKGKGTPMLREGVRSVEAFKDPEESECGSDWQGFE